MRLKLNKGIAIGLVVLGGISCTEAPKPQKRKDLTKKELVDHNRKLVRMESEQINKFIARRKWDMEETGSGVRYMIYEQGDSEIHPQADDTVFVKYEVSLINGKMIYKSDSTRLASFIVGHDQVESGLQEAIRFLSIGDKAKLIIPSHMAHGYSGDFNRIPKSSTVIFDISLIRING
jgi:FKBP-type peptidyl-prolyl cis-trans isomerase